jgi:O-antigen/teichoic acid export membrane protein
VGFGYLQFALAFASGIALVPLVLARVGSERYGLWLGFGELVAYSALVDVGVLGVLPWLVAERDGAGDRAGARQVVAGGFALALAAGLLFAALALGLLAVAPALTGVTPAQRAQVAAPLLWLVAGTAVGYPLRVFHAALVGLQDVVFNGWGALAQQAAGVALTLGLLLAGAGLHALAAAAALPPLLLGVACWLRLRRVAPELLSGWRRPGRELLVSLGTQGFGAWTAALGWRMIAATNTLVLLAVAGPEAAVVLAMTAKLGEIGMQMSWQLPDAGLVGLAQLRGEGRPERVREVVLAMLRVLLLASGAVACGVLAFNPGFVRLWVGADRFGGTAANALLAAGVLALSLGHGLFACAATLGERVRAGAATVAQGVFHLGAAWTLGRWFGLPGVAGAALLSSLVVAYPAGVWMLRRATGLSQGDLWRGALGPWAGRGAGLLALGCAAGALLDPSWAALALAPPLALLYAWSMRPLLAGVPLPGAVRALLLRTRLLPA